MAQSKLPALVALLALAIGCTERPRRADVPDAGLIDAAIGNDAAFVIPDTGPRPDSGSSLADVRIFAHSGGTLFDFSPYTNTVTTVGLFHAAHGTTPNMLDLAVDAVGHVLTSSSTTLWSVDPMTAAITSVGTFDVTHGEQFFALTFLAAGELHATETLVGATNIGAYYEIDPASAHTTYLGQYANGWLSSGDLVSVHGAGTYATIRRSGDTHDTLAQITFAAGGASTITVIGPIVEGTTEYTQIFGLGYWGRSVYGFSNSGQLVQIDRTTGAAQLTTTMTGTRSSGARA